MYYEHDLRAFAVLSPTRLESRLSVSVIIYGRTRVRQKAKKEEYMATLTKTTVVPIDSDSDRQAISVSHHQDVKRLLRRLKLEQRPKTPERPATGQTAREPYGFD
jgi:hypothetical protein